MVEISQHARRRMQKRSIPPIVLDWLQDYGSRQYDGRGAFIQYFDHAAKARLSRNYGHRFVQTHDRYLRVYMVEDTAGEAVITVGHRTRRVRRR